MNNLPIINTSIETSQGLLIVRHRPAQYESFIGGYTIECYEVYLNGSYMDNFTDLDSLNDYINDLVSI